MLDLRAQRLERVAPAVGVRLQTRAQLRQRTRLLVELGQTARAERAERLPDAIEEPNRGFELRGLAPGGGDQPVRVIAQLFVRDLSIVVADTLPAETIRGTIQASARDLAAPLTSVSFFDRYQGKGVPAGSVSLSVRLTFQATERTLTDAEVQQSVEAILAALVRAHGAVQR